MRYSIQEYLKKINSRLSFGDVLSISVTTLVLVSMVSYFYYQNENTQSEVIYKVYEGNVEDRVDERPFASSLGKTYTFSWCQNSSAISPENKIYFKNEEEAVASGRILSKLCSR